MTVAPMSPTAASLLLSPGARSAKDEEHAREAGSPTPVESKSLSEVIDELKADASCSAFLDANLKPEHHVGVAVRENRIVDALSDAQRAASALSTTVREEVIRRKEALLAEVDAVAALEKEVSTVAAGVEGLASASSALEDALSGPYRPMQRSVSELTNIQATLGLLRAISRYRFCTRKLEDACLYPTFHASRKTTPATLPDAAEAVRELEGLVSPTGSGPTGLDKIDLVAKSLPAVRKAGPELRRRATAMLKAGIAGRDQTMMVAAVLAFQAIGTLTDRVNAEVGRLLSDVQMTLQRGLEQTRPGSGLSLSAAFTGASSDGVTSSGAVTKDKQGLNGGLDDTDALLWKRVEEMLDGVRESCAKAVLLQQVLSKTFDETLHTSLLHEPIASAFIDATAKALGEQLGVLSRTQRQQSSSNSVYASLALLYPQLRAAIVAMSARIDTLVRVSPHPILATESRTTFPLVPDRTFVETCFLSALTDLETHYLSESHTRLSAAVSTMFQNNREPREAELVAYVRLLAGDLVAAKGNPDLHASRVANVATSLRTFASRVEDYAAAMAPDEEAVRNGPTLVSDWHLLRMYNGLISLVSFCNRALGAGEDGVGALPPAVASEVRSMTDLGARLLEGPFSICMGHLSKTMERMHTEDLTTDSGSDDGCSLYAMDLTAQLSMFAEGVVAKLRRTPTLSRMTLWLGQKTLDTFVRHACIVFPLPPAARTRLCTDVARVEMAVESLCPARMLGRSYVGLRGLRHLLVMSDHDLAQTGASIATTLVGLPPSAVVHHIMSRCSSEAVVHPHRKRDITPHAFVNWVEQHGEDDAWEEVSECVNGIAAPAPSDASGNADLLKAITALSGPLRKTWVANRDVDTW